MAEYNSSYCEVIPDQTVPDTWKEICLNTGGTQSTLQDIKVAERANGFCFRDASKYYTRNRFIYWRKIHDILEIVEQSLDINLSANKVRYKFVDTPILDGITVHETYDNVIVLVPTVCSVHRLIFSHPDRLHRQDELVGSHPDLAVSSIFADASAGGARNPLTFHVFNNPNTANPQLPNAAASWLTLSEEAIFTLSYPSGEILLLKQSVNGQCVATELKYESMMPRFLAGFADRFRTKNSDDQVVVSILMHTIGLETYAFTLSRSGHLRIWSCSKEQCVGVTNVLSDMGETGRQLIPGAQNHILRKAVGASDADFILAVSLSFASECQFHILKLIIEGSQFRVVRLMTHYTEQTDLIDFTLSFTHIWSLWRNEGGDCSIDSAVLKFNNGGTDWVPVILEPLPDADLTPENLDMDPHQAYLQHIFYPGRFPLHIISKALSIYKQSTFRLTDIHLSAAVLKLRVSEAVDYEIQRKLQETEVNDDEYLECASWCWATFYSCCVQYHVAGLRPLGLVHLPAVSGVLFLKKSMYSFLRPLDALEQMMLRPGYTSEKQFIYHPLLSEDPDVTGDVIKLTRMLAYLDRQLSRDFKYLFEKELMQLVSPDVIMNNLLAQLLAEMDSDYLSSIIQDVNGIKDIYQAMHKLLELLRIEHQQNSHSSPSSNDSLMLVNHLFSSQLGVSVVTQCLHQQAVTRFAVSRNLLILQNILLDRKTLQWSVLEPIRSICSLDVVVLTQACYTLLWLSELPALQTLPMESTMQRLAPLKLAPVFNLKTNTLQTISLLELFAGSAGGFEAHKNFAKNGYDEETLAHWHTSLLPYVDHLAQLVWPISGNPILATWLLSSGQHIWLQQYVRHLNNWCEWNNCTRNFLLAAAFLNSEEQHKALTIFSKTAKGIFTDSFFKDRFLDLTYYARSEATDYVNYYLKVIQLFELHGARDCAIKVAKTALSIAEKNDPHIATLHSIKFIHYLALGSYDEAYNSMNANPDSERKKDNLRELVKTLLERRELAVLMSFPYVEMEELFVNILFTRARATDSINNIYYDFLYAHMIQRGIGFMRLAASVMYEQAFRLIPYNTLDALEKQVKCYLAAVNCLSLCNPKFAWVVRPADPDREDEVICFPPLAGSDEEPEEFVLKHQIEVVDREGIQLELALASARLRLARFDSGTLANHLTSPNELIALLASVGMFKCALNLCKQFRLPYSPVFESLTKQCIVLSESNDKNAWGWLIENDLHDLPIGSHSPAALAWKLLQFFLKTYEEKHMSELHKAICRKIIHMGYFIPHWLLASYKKRNPAELLRLFLFNGRLEEAVELAGSQLLAALGHGKEHFGYKHALTATGPQFCLPVHTIDALIYELELQNEDEAQPYLKQYKYLKGIFLKYLETSARISNEMCHYKMSKAA